MMKQSQVFQAELNLISYVPINISGIFMVSYHIALQLNVFMSVYFEGDFESKDNTLFLNVFNFFFLTPSYIASTQNTVEWVNISYYFYVKKCLLTLILWTLFPHVTEIHIFLWNIIELWYTYRT